MAVAFVTGASSGIGAELSLELARRGYTVGCFARSADKLDEVVRTIESDGGKAIALPGDVTIPENLEAARDKLTETFGAADLVVANAGVGLTGPVHRIPTEKTREVFVVNVIGAVQTIELFLPAMLERGSGHVAGVSSLAAFRGFPKNGAYCASKAALAIYLESLRCELRRRGIFVTTICPGFVRTPMTAANGKMMFLLEADEAARRIANALAARRRVYRFPLPTSLLMRWVESLPNPLFERVTKFI